MTDLFQEPEDATPLEPHDRQALRQSWITNRQDLNQAEETNIAKGFAWASGRRLKPDEVTRLRASTQRPAKKVGARQEQKQS